MYKKSIFFILFLIFFQINIVSALDLSNYSNLIITDLNNYNKDDKLIIYENGTYYGIFNYSEPIPYRNGYYYQIIINEDFIDYSSSKDFLPNFFNHYGYLLITIIIVCGVIGIGIYIIKRMGR